MAAMRRHVLNSVKPAVKWLLQAADDIGTYQNVILDDLQVQKRRSHAPSAIRFDAFSIRSCGT
jgi:hypothetical protein